MAQIVTTALRLFVARPVLFTVLALAVVAPYELVAFAATGAPPLGSASTPASTTLTLGLIDIALVGPLISALAVQAVAMIGDGDRPTLPSVVSRGVRVLPVVAAAQIVAAFGIALGAFAFVIPGIILLIRWAVVAQVAAIERTDWLGALRRGGELVRGQYIHVFGLVLVATAFSFAVTAAAQSIVGSKARTAEVVVGIAAATIARSFSALATAVLFYDLRARERERQTDA